jgi:hypothetical protein
MRGLMSMLKLEQVKELNNKDHNFDAIFVRDDVKMFVNAYGWDALLDELNRQFPNYNLYSLSQDWFENRRFILKARGGNGDIIIGWYGAHVM